MSFTRSGVADTIRAEMARRHLTQREVAEPLGLSRAALSMRLTGRTPFTLDQAVVLADLFGMPLDDLVERQPVQVSA